MRTTLTLDDDVAAALERLRETGNKSLKEVVNEALRLGIQAMGANSKPKKPFKPKSVDLGVCRVSSLDNVAELIVIAEGDAFK